MPKSDPLNNRMTVISTTGCPVVQPAVPLVPLTSTHCITGWGLDKFTQFETG